MAIAYSATVGGVGTIIATPPNGVVVDQVLAKYNESLSFGGWIAAFLPLSVVLQICCFVIMYFTYGRSNKENQQIIHRQGVRKAWTYEQRRNSGLCRICIHDRMDGLA